MSFVVWRCKWYFPGWHQLAATQASAVVGVGTQYRKFTFVTGGGGVKKFSGDVGVWKWNALITVVIGYCSDIKEAT